MRADYDSQRYFILDLIAGTWPIHDTVVVGQGTDIVFGASVGETLTINVDGRERDLSIVGLISDPISQPPSFGGPAQFYVSQRTFEDLMGWRDFNFLLVNAEEFDEVMS
jgi:hypothetical protein